MRNGRLVVGIDFDGTLAMSIEKRFDEFFPNGNDVKYAVENLLFAIVDILGVGQKKAKKMLEEGVPLNDGLLDLIKRYMEEYKESVEFVIVTSNKNIEGIKKVLEKCGLDIDIYYSKRGGKNGYRFIDLILDDGYFELRHKVFWESRHNYVFADLFRRMNGNVVSSPTEFEQVLRDKMKEKNLIK